ncbi:hypothetical protein POM88_034007 [Heracleum sosnowskyi]|uniref:Uncharacterized protein n=1 Tax=Heracleum sosnowskyi TaxID=360622 RepID=A0AAD8HKW1_9APIA|nr:hypothetical protein POM88_034007 [Heracleum sosnowskyi]
MKQLEELVLTDCSGLTEINGLEGLTSIQKLNLQGCNLSLLKSTLTKRLFQIYSGFGHQITIYTSLSAFPDWVSQDWISRTSNFASTVFTDLPPDVSHNALAMILFRKNWGVCFNRFNYSVKTNTNVFELTDMPLLVFRISYLTEPDFSSMIIVPRTVFSVTDSDDRIEFTAHPHRWGDEENVEIFGIHLLYKSDVTLIDSTSINVDEENIKMVKTCIYSGFGHQITIYAPLSVSPDWVDQDWISRTSNSASTVSSDLPPDVSPNFMAMILCCKNWDIFNSFNYSVKTNTNVFESTDMPSIEFIIFLTQPDFSSMIIVPRTVFSVTDSDDRIEFTAHPHQLGDEENVEILGIHLLYKSDVTH